MPSIARPGPIRVLLALIVASLPLGWIGRSWLPAPIAVPLALAALLIPLAIAVGRKDDPLEHVALRATLVGLAVLGIAGGVGLGPTATGWTLCLLTAVLLLRSQARPALPPPRRRLWLVVPLVLVAALVIHQPLPLTLSSDAPAHVAAILDARETNSLQPPDVHPGAREGSVDPRYGVLHGFHAAIADWTAASAANTLRWSALFFGPLWFLAHLRLAIRLGMGPVAATVVAFVYTLYAGSGRGFALSSAGFPGSVAQTMAALVLASLLDRSSPRGGLLAVAVLALSTVIHPFAWWSTSIVAGCAGSLMLLRSASRPEGRRWLGWAVVSVVAGAVVLAPRLLARGATEGDLHTELNDVVMIGAGLFVADPFWIFRWGGVASVTALPALLLVAVWSPEWARRPAHLVGISLAVPVWLISLNPLLAPPAWSMVSYLIVRLGRVVFTTWVWMSALQQGAARWRAGGWARVAGAVLVVVGLAGFRHELSTAWLHLRQPQVVNAAGTDEHLDEVAAALGSVRSDWLLAAPRIGYGLRARGGPRLILPPVAHASPNDSGLMLRLARWRQLHDPALDDGELRDRLAEFGRATLLVDARTVRVHDGLNEYGYVPDRERALALERRLRALQVPVLVSGPDWALFGLEGADRMHFADRDAPGPDAGPAFRIAGARLSATTAAPGSVVGLDLDLEATGERPVRPERVFVRVEGEMPPAPAGLEGVSKLWRKFVSERSGRSERRFGQWVVPAGLVVPPARWPEGRWTQQVDLRIPAWAAPGEYRIQLTVHEWFWHGHRELGDFLSDTDRFSAPAAATLRIED